MNREQEPLHPRHLAECLWLGKVLSGLREEAVRPDVPEEQEPVEVNMAALMACTSSILLLFLLGRVGGAEEKEEEDEEEEEEEKEESSAPPRNVGYRPPSRNM